MNSEKLSVTKILLGAFLIPWWNASRFAKSLAIPALVLIPLTVGAESLVAEDSNSILFEVFFVTFCLFSALFAITTHRLVLLPNADYKQTFQITAFSRIGKFILWVIILAIIENLLSAPAFLVLSSLQNENAVSDLADQAFSNFGSFLFTTLFQILLSLPAMYVASRLSLALPSSAVDRSIGLAGSWKSTRGNGWRMVVVVFLLPGVLFSLLNLIPLLNIEGLTLIIAIPLVGIGFIVQISALSLSYQELVNKS